MTETTMQDLKQDINELRALTGANTAGIAKIEAVIGVLTDRIQVLAVTIGALTETIRSNDKLHTMEIEHLSDSLETVKAHTAQITVLQNWQAGHDKWASELEDKVTKGEKNVEELTRWQDKNDGKYSMLGSGIAAIISLLALALSWFRH